MHSFNYVLVLLSLNLHYQSKSVRLTTEKYTLKETLEGTCCVAAIYHTKTAMFDLLSRKRTKTTQLERSARAALKENSSHISEDPSRAVW